MSQNAVGLPRGKQLHLFFSLSVFISSELKVKLAANKGLKLLIFRTANCLRQLEDSDKTSLVKTLYIKCMLMRLFLLVSELISRLLPFEPMLPANASFCKLIPKQNFLHFTH